MPGASSTKSAAPNAAALAAAQAEDLLKHLPRLPHLVRYYDDFLGTWHTVQQYPLRGAVLVHADGRTGGIDFDAFTPAARETLRHVLVDWFARLDAKSVRNYLQGLAADPTQVEQVVAFATTAAPPVFRQRWIEWFAAGALAHRRLCSGLRQVLYSFCRLRIGQWSGDYEKSVEALPAPKYDAYRSLRTGDCFIPVGHQSVVTDHFDEISALVQGAPEVVGTDALLDACLLVVTFQHGVRPGQTARVGSDDVRFHDTGAVHIRFLMMKQGDNAPVHHIRRIKREWCPLFIEYAKRLGERAPPADVPAASFFRLKPPAVQSRIARTSGMLTGEEWSAGDYRHTGAQRLADAGASHEEISEFLMQAQLRTATIYFDASPNQAQKVNRAMGLSRIYRAVEGIARTRTIDKAELAGFAEDKQIGGTPHGVPIAGIGACSVGQSACAKNPVLSCYTCRKFLAVRDAAVHSQVADHLRGVVRDFYETGREASTSPAFGQLRQTIEAADSLADRCEDVEGREGGL